MESHELHVSGSAAKGQPIFRIEAREINANRDDSALMRLGKTPILKVCSISICSERKMINDKFSATLALCQS